MRDYLSQLKPTCIEDLMQMTSLYRPGPMASIPEFIARKKGESNIKYLHPLLETIYWHTVFSASHEPALYRVCYCLTASCSHLLDD